MASAIARFSVASRRAFSDRSVSTVRQQVEGGAVPEGSRARRLPEAAGVRLIRGAKRAGALPISLVSL